MSDVIECVVTIAYRRLSHLYTVNRRPLAGWTHHVVGFRNIHVSGITFWDDPTPKFKLQYLCVE
jgi:hypothetical protein